MSDGTWDAEYDKADALKEEITRYCKENNIACPIFEEHARSWDLEKTFEGIKKIKLKPKEPPKKLYRVDSCVCDYGIYEYEGTKLISDLIFNSRKNAEIVCEIMNLDAEHKVYEGGVTCKTHFGTTT